jgi:hypothetical protein
MLSKVHRCKKIEAQNKNWMSFAIVPNKFMVWLGQTGGEKGVRKFHQYGVTKELAQKKKNSVGSPT